MPSPSSSAILGRAETKALLVSSPINVQYLTGLQLSFGLVLALPNRFILFTDARYIEAAERKAAAGITVKNMKELERTLEKIKECGVEADEVTLSQFRRWKRRFKNTKLVHTKGIIEEFRRQKSENELRFFKRAQKITQELIRRVPSQLRRSISEKKLAWQLQVWARELGADGLSFDPIVGFGTHTSSPHHQPTDRKLKKGDIVQIDVGARYKGYCADQSEVFFTGKPTKLQAHFYNVLCEAKDAAIAAVKPGATTHELDRIARAILEREGIEENFTHALGHGVGLEIHEGVSISQKAPVQELLPGEIITIEPGVYFPGKFGMRVEEEVIVR